MIEFEEHRFGFKDYRRSEKSQNSRDAQRALLCREDQLLLRFFGEGSSQLKLNRGSLAQQGAESSGRPFSTSCSSTCRSTCKLRDLKSPAPIPDQGSFHAHFPESSDLSKLSTCHFQGVYPDRVSSGSVMAELSSALFQSLAILTSRNRCSWSSTLRDLPESICVLIFANIGADSPKGT